MAPILAAALGSDVIRSVTRHDLAHDRAMAIEVAFEQAWSDFFSQDPNRADSTFTDDFNQLWQDDAASLPSLIFNGTNAVTGERLIFSNLDFEPGQTEAGQLQRMLGNRTVNLSTAVMMSARFPFVSPVGRLTITTEQLSAEPVGISVVDGGFADNFGSTSLVETIAVFLKQAEAMNLAGHLRPVIVRISNEPKVPKETRPLEARLGLITPFETLNQIRVRHTQRSIKELDALIDPESDEKEKEDILQFQLAGGAEHCEFPLGWMLATLNRAGMTAQIHQESKPTENLFERVRSLVGPPAEIRFQRCWRNRSRSRNPSKME